MFGKVTDPGEQQCGPVATKILRGYEKAIRICWKSLNSCYALRNNPIGIVRKLMKEDEFYLIHSLNFT